MQGRPLPETLTVVVLLCVLLLSHPAAPTPAGQSLATSNLTTPNHAPLAPVIWAQATLTPSTPTPATWTHATPLPAKLTLATLNTSVSSLPPTTDDPLLYATKNDILPHTATTHQTYIFSKPALITTETTLLSHPVNNGQVFPLVTPSQPASITTDTIYPHSAMSSQPATWTPITVPHPPTYNTLVSPHQTSRWLTQQQSQKLIEVPDVLAMSQRRLIFRKSTNHLELREHLEGLGSVFPAFVVRLSRTDKIDSNIQSLVVNIEDFPNQQPLSPSPPRLFTFPSKNLITRRSADFVTSTSLVHRRRHGHHGRPNWLRHGIDEALLEVKNQVLANQFEEEIAEVFRDVAYGESKSKVIQKRPDSKQTVSSGGNSRIERTTVLSEEPQNDYVADRSDGNAPREQRNVSPPDSTPPSSTEDNKSKKKQVPKRSDLLINSMNDVNNKTEKSLIEKLLQLNEYDGEMYDLYEEHYVDRGDVDKNSDVSGRGDTLTGETSHFLSLSDKATNTSHMTQRDAHTTHRLPRQPTGPNKPVPRVSWFDVLLCTNRNLTWILINFLIGFVLLILSFLGPYRLMTLRCCTHLLPRTHYVAVLLLVFVAASLKAVYVFHLAYGSRGHLPLILILLLTNTGFPCFSSAFLILMIMMFLTADVQVYKPKLLSMQNIFIFIVMKLVLCFVADVIVGCAHSKSVLVLSRVMLIIVAVAVILVFIRKHQVVLQVSQMLQREFQGELKLLVLPAKDVSQQRQMDIKFILRNRLSLWCQVMKAAAVCIALLAVIHLFHTIFLISSHVPAWAWWIFHGSGCIMECILSVLICVAAALTQRYNENISFLYNFLIPPALLQKKKSINSKASNGDALYQRVSFSSGTESTQYTTSYPEAGLAGFNTPSRTPKAPRRRGATVRRSATFSHAPYYRHEPRPGRSRVVPQPMVPRTGSVSQIPIYGLGSGSHLSIYGPGLVSHLPIYSPPSDASVLVHEDGFVRVRTQTDPNEASMYPRGSLIRLQQSHFVGSHPQPQGLPAQHLNGLGRQDSFYASLSRRRMSPHGANVLQNNIEIPEGEYQSSPRIRRSQSHRSHPHSASQAEVDYHSLSRKRSLRDPHMEQLNNVEEENDYPQRRRRSSREPHHYYLNNLDRPESDYRSLTQRQISREDNNDPMLQLAPGADIRRNDRLPPLNLYEEHPSYPSTHPYSSSPTARHKISNISVSAVSPAISPVHSNYACASPHSARREAQFPKPFVRAGSNVSLQGEDIFYTDYIPRGNPVRRNHSSAGYFSSRNHAPPSPSLTDGRRYGSLRLGAAKKRQVSYHGAGSSGYGRVGHNHYDKHERRTEDEDTVSALPTSRSPEKGSSPGGPEERERECPSRQSNASKHSDGSDQDWASEIIKSSSILTDFYTLERPSKKKSKRKENENDSKDNDS